MNIQSIEKLEAKELQKARLVIGQFIKSCSHSMRGPLKSIDGLVTLLNDVNFNSRQDKKIILDLIGDTTQKMEHMLDELEHFMENSKRGLTLTSIDCQEVLDAAIHAFHDEITAANIKVSTSLDQTTPFYSDLSRFRLIISHLLANAVQFSDPRKMIKEITLSLTVNSKICKVVARDNGIGIDPKEHFKIFQLFYRASEQSSGAGLGLYVVRELVEKMGGGVFVKSVLNQGSTFTVELPNPSHSK